MASALTTRVDLSFSRYQFDEFKKNTKARQVPFEEIDYSIYKTTSNCIAFTTSEERITTWIKTFYLRYCSEAIKDGGTTLKSTWDETPAQNDATKSEKISITLSTDTVTIIIYCSTGRIQIQCKSLRVWGDNEFPIIKDLVYQNVRNTSNFTSSKNIQTFLKTVSQPPMENECDVTNPAIITVTTEDLPPPPNPSNPCCEKSLTTMKNNIEDLESSFVSFKQEIFKSYEDLKHDLTSKDKEINMLKKRIGNLEATNELLRKDNIELNSLSKKEKQIEKKVSNTIDQYNKLKKNN
jgi:ribosomal protein S15P/S13E